MFDLIQHKYNLQIMFYKIYLLAYIFMHLCPCSMSEKP